MSSSSESARARDSEDDSKRCVDPDVELVCTDRLDCMLAERFIPERDIGGWGDRQNGVIFSTPLGVMGGHEQMTVKVEIICEATPSFFEGWY